MLKNIIIVTLLSLNIQAQSLSLYMQNDFINDTDRYYTHGTDISYMSNTLKTNESFEQYAISLSQDIYTPSNGDDSNISKHDFPYAGYLGATFAYFQSKYTYYNKYFINIGVVGSKAQAKKFQEGFHDLSPVNHGDEYGWDYELDNKFLYSLGHTFAHRTVSYAFQENYKIEWFNNSSFEYGSYIKQIALGSNIRFGYNIPNNFAIINDIQSLKVNKSNTNNNSGWSITNGLYYNYLEEFYIFEEAKKRYTLPKNKNFSGQVVSFDYYKNRYTLSLLLKSGKFLADKITSKEKWIGLLFIKEF